MTTESLVKASPVTSDPVVDTQGLSQMPSQVTKPRKPSTECTGTVTIQTVRAISSQESIHSSLNVVQAMMSNINPQDDIETMLAGQMIVLHHAIMANAAVLSGSSDMTFSSARMQITGLMSKMMRTYATVLDALNRHRNQDKIYQNLSVGHVDVHHGGQAIVGNVTQQSI